MNDELTPPEIEPQASEQQEAPGVSEWQGAGAKLRQARERLNLSLEDVAVQIKTAPRKLAALEDERWSELPERPYLRGLVRNYARVLQIDSEPLLRSIDAATGNNDRPQEFNVKPALHAPFPQRAAGPHESPVNRLIVIGIILCVIVIGAMVLPGVPAVREATGMVLARWHRDDATVPATEGTPSVTARELSGAADSSAVTVNSQAASSGVLATNSTALAALAAAPGNLAAPAPGGPKTPPSSVSAEGASLASAPPTTASRLASVASITPGAPLSLRFNEDSWVEVRQPDGKVISSQVYRAGTEQSIDASHPIELVIGNAPGVSLSSGGKGVDLDPYTHSRVARLNFP